MTVDPPERGRASADGGARALGDAAHEQDVAMACTSAPIAAVRVTLDSAAVAGWDELDAIGVVPCDAP